MDAFKKFFLELAALFEKHEAAIDAALDVIPSTPTGEVIKEVSEGAVDVIADEGKKDAAH